MSYWTEEDIENFIKGNKDKFDIYHPEPNHENKFFVKLYNKFKRIVSIIPYLIKVFTVTIIVFIVSIWIWNNYIRKDRNEMTLKQKMENIIHVKK